MRTGPLDTRHMIPAQMLNLYVSGLTPVVVMPCQWFLRRIAGTSGPAHTFCTPTAPPLALISFAIYHLPQVVRIPF
jgi:hypothetical protein